MEQVRADVNRQIANLMAWSLHYAALGVYPHRGFYDEPFESNTYRASLAGQPIAGEYKPPVTPQRSYFSNLNGIVCAWFRMPKLKNKKQIPSTPSMCFCQVDLHGFQGRPESTHAVS